MSTLFFLAECSYSTLGYCHSWRNFRLSVCPPSVIRVKVKDKGLDTCYSATYVSQTRDQQCFTILEVAADWHEPMVPQHILWPSTAHANGHKDPRCS